MTMYESFFGMKKRPFPSVAQFESYYTGIAVENARLSLTRCLERGEGIGLLIGPTGTGKTLLGQCLATLGRKAGFKVVFLSSGHWNTRRSLFQAILYELGQPYRGMDEGELRIALLDYLTQGKEQSIGMILIMDEAHTLPLRLLEELRTLTNLSRSGVPLVRLALIGSGIMEERLGHPKLDSFNQRICTRCYLEAFYRTETGEYIGLQMLLAGAKEDVFTEEARQSVYQATDGVPRLINQFCDHALCVAASVGRRQLEALHIEAAWADLQQLPTPWNNDRETEVQNVIEFGQLDDPEPVVEEIKTVALDTKSPRLLVTEETIDFDAFELDDIEIEPEQKIEQIEKMIATAEIDFSPAGKIGPEVELYFEETEENPFAEPFEEEETIDDHYAALAPPPTPPAPTTVSKSVASPSQAAPSVSAVSKEAIPSGSVATAQACPTGYGGPRIKTPIINAEEPEVTLEIADDAGALLIIEDDETVVLETTLKSEVKPVRKQEYSRLFARLRQG